MQKIPQTPAGLLHLILVLIIVILLLLFLFYFISSNAKADYKDNTIEKNIQSIERFDYSNVSTVEEEIDKLKTTAKTETSAATDKAAYQKAFRGNIILGDSVTEGISAYGYLPEDIVFSKIGASVMTCEDLFSQAAATYPKNGFFAMGMNDMGNYKDDVDGFIKQYKKCLKDFKKTSPKTKIYICSISHPSAAAINRKSWLGNYDKYNKQIKAMCKDMKYTYIDVSSIFDKHPELYEQDGIHASTAYYPYWLKMMADAADLDLDL